MFVAAYQWTAVEKSMFTLYTGTESRYTWGANEDSGPASVATLRR